MDSIFDKLKTIEKRYEQISKMSVEPEIINNSQKYKELMKEYKTLTPIAELYNKYKKIKKEYDEANDLLKDPTTETELKNLAESEFLSSKQNLTTLENKLKTLLLSRDSNDDKNVILEIRSGAGGEEAALFAGDLLRMYTMYAEKKRFKLEVLNLNETERGGIKEISVEIIGKGAYSRFKYEKGVHRVQRVPKTESQGRIHTSTVTVAVLPEAEEVELKIDPKDIEMAVFRASSNGGQKVNKTSSAIRLTYIPTGLVVECQEERSQFQNKFKAMKVLRSRLLEQKQNEADKKLADERKEQVGTGDRSERIRTYNFPQGRVSDHRINLTLYTLEKVMDGELDEIIDALATDEQAKLLGENGYV